MEKSGYVKGKLIKCSHNASDNTISVSIDGLLNNSPVSAPNMKLFLDGRNGEKADGYYYFMSMCKLLGEDKPVKDEYTGEFKGLIGKEIVLGIQCVYSEGYSTPLRNIQSVHDPVTGQTLTEKNAGTPAEKVKQPIKDWYKKPKGGVISNDSGEAPESLGAAPEMPVDEDLPF
jgi:hypothetical protein